MVSDGSGELSGYLSSVDLRFLIVTAIQHLDLSKILLTVYDPRIPRLGPSQRAAAKRIEVSNSSALIESNNSRINSECT